MKVNDSKDTNFGIVLSSLSKHLDLSIKDILDTEFFVFTALEFSLHISQEEYIPHFERIFNYLGNNSVFRTFYSKLIEFSNIQEYLGERMYNIWTRSYE